MSQDNSKKKPIPEREIALHVFACGGPITKCVLRPLEFPGRPSVNSNLELTRL